MITHFNGTKLSLPLQFIEEWHSTNISQDSQTTIAGSEIFYQQYKITGQKITLQNYENGYLKKSEVDAIVALARTLNQTITITDSGANVISCKFDFTEGGAVVANPSRPYSLWYEITIKLIRI